MRFYKNEYALGRQSSGGRDLQRALAAIAVEDCRVGTNRGNQQ
jgi:hypothetical protein